MENMNVLELAKKLISIPSYVGENFNEKQIGEFLFEYLKKYQWLKVKKQSVLNGRFNLIIRDNYPTKILITAHLDTVQPNSGWKTNPFKPEVKNDKLFGLGSTDMKGSLAALLCALDNFKITKGLMILLYIDEEYNFLGMKKFLNEYRSNIKPDLIVSADGYDLKLGNGCRGLIEIKFIITGQTGHASNPKLGNNAILGATKIVNKLIKILARDYQSKDLGQTSCNLAFLQGGLDLGKNQESLLIGREGNNIADIAEFILDIRPADINLNAGKVIQMVEKLSEEEDLIVLESKIRHDFESWITKKQDLKEIERIADPNYLDIGSWGYIDIQMLWKSFNQVPCFTFGAGNLNLAHKVNEYVEVKNLEESRLIFIKLLNLLKGGE